MKKRSSKTFSLKKTLWKLLIKHQKEFRLDQTINSLKRMENCKKRLAKKRKKSKNTAM